MMPILLLLSGTVVLTLGTGLFLFCMRRFLFASCFDRLIPRFFGIVAVGGRILTLLEGDPYTIVAFDGKR